MALPDIGQRRRRQATVWDTLVKKLLPVIETRLRTLPRGLREHVERVRKVGRELALRHGVDADLVDQGTAAHDLARAVKGEVLLEQARHYGLRVSSVERHSPILLHGPVAALWLTHEGGITDQRLLDAVRWHTTGKRGMGDVAKVVFLADKLDPCKVKRYPNLGAISDLARDSLDRALLEFLDQELDYLLREGLLVHPASVELRNELITALP